MGFSGGGSNVLKPHKHSSAVQDGSPLNMVNVTEGSLNSGDVIFSDGAALQRLAIGTPAQQLRVSAGNIPEWYTPAASSAVYEEIASTTLGVAQNDITLTFPAVSGSDVAEFYFVTNGAVDNSNEELAIQINGYTVAGSYDMQRLNVQNGVTTSSTHNANYWKPYGLVPGDAGRFFGRMHLQLDVTGDTPSVLMQCQFNTTDYNLPYSGVITGLADTSLTEVKLYGVNGNNIKAGSSASLFKINI